MKKLFRRQIIDLQKNDAIPKRKNSYQIFRVLLKRHSTATNISFHGIITIPTR